MKIGVVGGGYVGLTTGVCFSSLGHDVFVVEKVEEKVKKLKEGIPPFYEPGLEELLKKMLMEGKIRFSTNIKEMTEFSEIIFICVGTPPKEDGYPDLSQIEEAAREIALHLRDYRVIVEKSTVPVRTSYWIERTIRLNLHRPVEFDVASNPEFLREGSAIKDFLNPDRIVIGVSSERAKNILLELYKDFQCPKIITDISSAELIKHASNSFLAMKISFANLLSEICEKTGANVEVVTHAIGLDRRIGTDFLKAGIGYGGSCFPKDIKAFIKIGEELGIDMSLLKDVHNINERRIDIFISKLKGALWNIKGKTITILGISFKPDTDDIREAPSLKLSRRLREEGAYLKLYDPKAVENAKREFPENPPEVEYFSDPYLALQNADAACVVTEWEEVKKLDLKEVKRIMRTPIIVDGRNVYNPQLLREAGIEYYPTGIKF